MHFLKSVERAARRLVPEPWRKYFRASRAELLLARRAPVDLVVHVGAHWAEDAGVYEANGARTVLWIEADPDTFAQLTARLAERDGPTRHLAECALVSADAGVELGFNRFNGDGSSSSVHAATETLRARFGDVHETGEVLTMTSRRLPDILAGHGIDPETYACPMLVVDVQGHELAVLRGLGGDLCRFAICKCEVSRIPVYAGAPLFPEIDAHFARHGFRLASHRRVQVPRHGDVLYLRDAPG
ncbi:MAG: FkbM family methyltransferase [Rhodobacteraceae bacterium]|nr:FkbM family methyltransferase [Paracoccaceae bacterium]